MSLADKVVETLTSTVDFVIESLGEQIQNIFVWAGEKLLSSRREELKGQISPILTGIIADGSLPADTIKLFQDALDGNSISDIAWFIAGGFVNMMGVMSAAGTPVVDKITQNAYDANRVRLPVPEAAIEGLYKKNLFRSDFDSIMHHHGFNDDAINLMDANYQPLLQPDQLRQLYLRNSFWYDKVNEDLEKGGWTPHRANAIRELWYQLPGLGDITEMARKLAFSPESKTYWPWAFDAPEDFKAQAAKIGLHKDYAAYYWFIHWQQPSPTMQFEMLHRGQINAEDVRRTLWGLGYSDWWIPKIIATAYHPFTRVDLRRMYKLGVLSVAEVKKGYKDLGYDDAKAQDLTDFTIRYYTPDDESQQDTEDGYTLSEILSSYRAGSINQWEARDMMEELGYDDTQIEYYLSKENYAREQAIAKAYLSRYRVLFVEGIKTSGECKTELVAAGIPASQFHAELPLWQLDKVTRVAKPTLSQLGKFLDDGIISQTEWQQEMELHGYSAKYINWYKASLAG